MEKKDFQHIYKPSSVFGSIKKNIILLTKKAIAAPRSIVSKTKNIKLPKLPQLPKTSKKKESKPKIKEINKPKEKTKPQTTKENRVKKAIKTSINVPTPSNETFLNFMVFLIAAAIIAVILIGTLLSFNLL